MKHIAMPQNKQKIKLLFIISHDFGELNNAMSLLQGYDFAGTLVMPQRLFAINQNSLPVSTYAYNSLQDIYQVLQCEQPDIVLLFSGYLYVINQIFTLDTFAELVKTLQQNYTTVTSDPFLGILSQLNTATFSDRHPQKQWLERHFARVEQLLKNIIHLYPVKLDNGFNPQRISCFNPHLIIRPSILKEDTQKLAEIPYIDCKRQRWLYILSSEDYSNQASKYGQERFTLMLLEQVVQAIRGGKQPIIIAPQVCIDPLQHRISSPIPIIFLSFCNYVLFRILLLEAQYVFYWNIFSHSIPTRVINHLPVFFFDVGHMVQAIKPLLSLGIQQYYAGAKLVCLNIQQPFTIEQLATLADEQKLTLAKARKNFQLSPSPPQIFEKILKI